MSWPELSVTRYTPTHTVRKVPISAHRQFGDRHALVTPDRRTLVVADEDGEPQFRFRSPDFVQQVEFQPQSETFYVRSSSAIHALDKQGREWATIAPEKLSCLGSMTVLADGRLAVAVPLDTFRDGQVVLLNPDLTPDRSLDTPVACEKVLDAGNGAVAALDDGERLQIFDREGRLRLDSESPRLYSPLVHEGNLMFVEAKPSRYSPDSGEVVRYDSATHAVTRIPVNREVDRLVPLPGGGFLVEDGEAGEPRLSVYDREGELLRRYRFPRGNYFRQLHLVEGAREVLAVTGDDVKRLYRLSLEPSKRILFKTERPQPILERTERFIPALLSDGRLVLFGPGGVEGYSSPAEFVSSLQPGTRVLTRRCPTGMGDQSNESCEARLDEVLAYASRAFHLADGLASRPPADGPFLTPDNCWNFVLPASGLPEATRAALSQSQQVLRAALFDRVSSTSFPGEPEVKLNHYPDRLEYVNPVSEWKPTLSGEWLAAVPLKVEGRRHVAAASAEGKLTWWALGDDWRTEQVEFDLGEPATGMTLSPDGQSVLVATASGLVQLDPARGPLQAAEKDRPATAISEGADSVRVGGVVIRKRRV